MGKGVPEAERYLHIYTRSRKQKEKFEQIASEANASSTSAFYLNVLETWQANREGLKPPKRGDDQALKEENTKLREELKIKSLLLGKYEAEIRLHRGEDFLRAGFQGRRHFDADLLEILRHGQIGDQKLLQLLHVDLKDPDQVEAVAKQLEWLQASGYITKTVRGWKWIG